MSQSDRADDVEHAPGQDAAPGHDPGSGPDAAPGQAPLGTEPAAAAPAEPAPETGRLGAESPEDESPEDELPAGATPGPAVSAAEAMALADPLMVRRAPRYGRFAMTGVVLGIVLCAVAVLLFAEPNQYRSLLGVYLLVAAFVVPVFALLGCLLALLLERGKSASSRKSARGG